MVLVSLCFVMAIVPLWFVVVLVSLWFVMVLVSILFQVTVKEQQEWKIPPCISNWKNAKVSLPSLISLACIGSYNSSYRGNISEKL